MPQDSEMIQKITLCRLHLLWTSHRLGRGCSVWSQNGLGSQPRDRKSHVMLQDSEMIKKITLCRLHLLWTSHRLGRGCSVWSQNGLGSQPRDRKKSCYAARQRDDPNNHLMPITSAMDVTQVRSWMLCLVSERIRKPAKRSKKSCYAARQRNDPKNHLMPITSAMDVTKVRSWMLCLLSERIRKPAKRSKKSCYAARQRHDPKKHLMPTTSAALCSSPRCGPRCCCKIRGPPVTAQHWQPGPWFLLHLASGHCPSNA